MLALALVQGWATRFEVTPDGVAYLDMSDGVVTGDWARLVNGYWSPLYPTLLGIARRLTTTSAYSETIVAHVLNVVLLLVALGTLEYFLRGLAQLARGWDGRSTRWLLDAPYGRFAARVLGGGLLVVLVPVRLITPDLLVAAATLAAFGAVVRLRAGSDGRAAIVLGVALGVGALAKAFMIPWAVIVIACALVGTTGRARGHVARAAALWVVIAGAWVAVLSSHLGRPTLGDTGRLTYVWYVNQRGAPSDAVMPPSTRSAAFAAAGLEGGVLPDGEGTFPVWADPSRWYADAKVDFDPMRNAAVSWALGTQTFTSFSLILAVLALALVGLDRARLGLLWNRSWPVLLPTIAGVGAYTLILITTRYIAAFVAAGLLMLWYAMPRLGTIGPWRAGAGLALPIGIVAVSPIAGELLYWHAAVLIVALTQWLMRERSQAARLAMAVGAVIVAALALPRAAVPQMTAAALALVGMVVVLLHRAERDGEVEIANHILRRSTVLAAVSFLALLTGAKYLDNLRPSFRADGHTDANVQWSIAQKLRAAGAEPGESIAVIGDPFAAVWARAGRYRIAATVEPRSVRRFLTMSEAERAPVLAAMRRAGVDLAVVATRPASVPLPPGWTPMLGGGVLRLD